MSPNARLLLNTFAAAVLGASCAMASTVGTPFEGLQSYGSGSAYAGWIASLSGSAGEIAPSGGSGSISGGSWSQSNFTFAGASMSWQPLGDPSGLYGSSITVTTAAGGETALLIDVQQTSFNVLLSDGETFNLVSPGWFGFSSPVSITSIKVSASGSTNLIVHDFWYGTSSQTGTQDPPPAAPEAATILLTSGGLLILLGSGQKLMQKRLL